MSKDTAENVPQIDDVQPMAPTDAREATLRLYGANIHKAEVPLPVVFVEIAMMLSVKESPPTPHGVRPQVEEKEKPYRVGQSTGTNSRRAETGRVRRVRGKNFTAEETEMIMAQNVTDRELSELLGRPVNSIIQRRYDIRQRRLGTKTFPQESSN